MFVDKLREYKIIVIIVLYSKVSQVSPKPSVKIDLVLYNIVKGKAPWTWLLQTRIHLMLKIMNNYA
jgi:hypothetical protein